MDGILLMENHPAPVELVYPHLLEEIFVLLLLKVMFGPFYHRIHHSLGDFRQILTDFAGRDKVEKHGLGFVAHVFHFNFLP